jgi:hypothetical protein
MRAVLAGDARARKRFFLKKEAKTFTTSGMRQLITAHVKWQKFFGSFFQKRTASFTC